MRILFTSLFFLTATVYASAQFSYINPLPGSQYHNPATTILLKNSSTVDRLAVSNSSFVEISGSVSGQHSWKARLSDDNQTVIVKPDEPFAYGETVTVDVKPLLRSAAGDMINGTSFNFKIKPEYSAAQKKQFAESNLENFIASFGYDPTKKGPGRGPTYPLDSMPAFTINVNNNPAPGQIFYCNNQDLDEDDTNSFPTIIQNNGTIVWARDCGTAGHDFKINQNGYLTYFKYSTASWMVMDSNYNLVDSLQCKNGYELGTNAHDLQMYPDGHSFLLAVDDQIIDMTPYGGVPNADVKGLIVQELDANRDVVFEWSSWDHFLFTDANNSTPLTNGQVDPVHGNAVSRDVDGNILISSRNMSELTKINHANGDIIWRMGGENNQFTFVNDNIPEHFSEQHDVRRIANGHITIFNNGNYLPVQVSSAKEYSVDEVNKIATLIWFYEHPDVNGNHVFGRGSGNAQRLPNGNTMISWGTIYYGLGLPSMTEVDMNKNIKWEMTFDEDGQKSYRTFKFVWDPCSRITGYTMKAVPKQTKTTLSWQAANGAQAYILNLRPIGTSNWVSKKTNKVKLILSGLAASTTYEWRVKTLCSMNPYETSAFSVTDTFTTPPLKLNMEEEEVTEMNVYPVPAHDMISVVIPVAGSGQLTLTNAMGSVVIRKEITAETAATVELSVGHLPAGVYFVQLKQDEHSFVQKIMIQ
jgi:hypothetical protein